MRKYKFLLIITAIFMLVFFSSCAELAGIQELNQEPTLLEQEPTLLEQELALLEQDIKNIEQANAVAEEKALQLMEQGFPIAIYEYYSATPNSVGGVNVIIFWKNISPKDFKYVIFTVKPYNAVDDVVYCTISHEADSRLKVTGPVKAKNMDEPSSSVWENVWYNNTIKRIEIEQIDIIYMDNSEESISASEVKEMFIDRHALYDEFGVRSIDEMFGGKY